MNSSLVHRNLHPIEIALSNGSKSNNYAAMLQAFSDEFSFNFITSVTPSSCPAGNAEGLRFSINVENVRRILAATPDTAAGEDGMSGKILKILGYELAGPLNISFQSSIA